MADRTLKEPAWFKGIKEINSYAAWRAFAQQEIRMWRAAGRADPGPELVWGRVAIEDLFEGNLRWPNPADAAQFIRTFHASLRWGALDCPTFALSHGLTAKLLLTDPSGIDIEDLRWPFDSFVVQLPGPDSPITYVCGATGVEVEVDYLVFHRYRVESAPGRGEHIDLDPDPTLLAAALRASTAPALYMAAQSTRSATILHRNWPEPATRAAFHELLTRCDMNLSKLGDGMLTSSIDEQANRAVTRLLVNLALYLGDLSAQGMWRETAPTNAKQRARAKRGELAPRRWELGREIKIGPELRALARSNVAADPLWKLKARFLVRGHWRNQACGPGRTERRRTWIEPHYRGPEAGERLARAYRVEDER
jgi:hypothetical protein